VTDVVARHGGKPPGLYTYRTQRHVDLYMSGKSFSGYDHDEGHHFNGSIGDAGVQLYDCGEGRRFNYSLHPMLDLIQDLVYLVVKNHTRAFIITIAILFTLLAVLLALR
jgi:hypothetical protein